MKLRTFLTLASLTTLVPVIFGHEGHEHVATRTTAPDKYPLTTCVVSGDALGEDGPPVTYTYKEAGKPDRVVKFCCEDCITDFKKDPASYLAKLDAAKAGQGGAAVKTATTPQPQDEAMSACCSDGSQSCGELVKAYVPVADALAGDDLVKAQSAATTLARQADADGMTTIYRPALAIAQAKDLAAARSAFKSLSHEVTPLVKDNKDFVVMHCPMADADWVQADATVRNPYFGKAMLSCGEPKSGT